MRILKIRFQNLNSLIGEWEIDLTHPAFSSDGIFAITGPTGAGKTTILDAICLALYGRTPRLDKISKSSNEIMSRQTGECFAELVFETQSGRYRCHWSQHRARKKPEGELQAPKHEIAHADSGQIIDATLRGVAEQIETVTGMDFDRFTRSMLLAQGGFAAFLQADPDKRAPILEQITGTEIYSQISIRVHESRSDERKKLELLQAELDGMQLLSEDDERQLRSSLEQMVKQEAALSQQVTRENQAITWLDGIAQLERDLAIVDKQKQDLFDRQTVFQPELEKLERAKQALELAGEFASLGSLRVAQATDQQGLNECLQALPEQQAEVERAEQALKIASDELEHRRVEQKEQLLVIRKVRELDLKIYEKKAPVETVKVGIVTLEKSLEMLRAENNENSRILAEDKIVHGTLQKLLADNNTDEGLIANLGRIHNRFDGLREFDGKQHEKQAELAQVEAQKSEAIHLWSEQSTTLEKQKKEYDAMQASLAQRQQERKLLLADRDIVSWRNTLAKLSVRKNILDNVSESVQSIVALRHMLIELHSHNEILAAKKATTAQQIQTQNEKQITLETEMQHLEKQLSLLKKIQDLEAARQHLLDGESCPLCGATEHPFAEGNIPVPDETMMTLNRVRADHKHANVTLSDLKVKEAETLKDMVQIAKQQNEIAERIAVEDSRVQSGLVDLSVAGIDKEKGEDLLERLTHLQQEFNDELENTSKVVQIVESHEQAIVGLRDTLEKVRETVVQLERDSQATTHKKDAADQAVARVKKELALLANQFEKTLADTLGEVASFGFSDLAMDALDQIQLALTSRRDQWIAWQKQIFEYDKRISNLALQTKLQAEQIRKTDVELKQQQDTLRDLIREQDALIQERVAIFSDNNSDDAESRLSVVIVESEKRLDDGRRMFNVTTQKMSLLKNKITSNEKMLLTRVEKLKVEEGAFQARLGTFGFNDEASYQRACLPEADRKKLTQQAQLLATEHTVLEASSREKTSLLASERQRKITEQSHASLAKALDELVTRLKVLQQEVGGISQKLKDNDNLRRQQQERAKSIDAQKRECSRWDSLHELIGSADGKKFRNFAQGLTFEMMVGHANRQLQKMTDRYLLIRDDQQPLELNVVDNYQAGEIRSTKNLSGGESFIVSLSLALGLSHMASKNVRVDSLFLDEGFGTLDEEALDTALETLAGLQQEGKLIGVISHVPTLKERISTQIQVSPHTGGRSVISGPGCSRVQQKVDA